MLHSLPAIVQSLWTSCFDINYSNTSDYSHLHLVLKEGAPISQFQQELVRFYEEAHRDAKQCFESMYGISLSPIPTGHTNVKYPNDLPFDALKGFFGEVLCAVISRHLSLIGNKTWSTPAFLFRYHNTAGECLYRLSRNESPNPSVTGRTGDDFLAFSFDTQGNISDYLVGEAKCHAQFNITKSTNALEELSNEGNEPISVGQIRDILKLASPISNPQLISNLDDIVFRRSTRNEQRTDLFLYIFERPGVVNYNPPTRIPTGGKIPKYTNSRDLQVVEVHFPNVMNFLNGLYGALYP